MARHILVKSLATAAFLAASTVAGFAATVTTTFDFRTAPGGGVNDPSYTTTVDGLTLFVNAKRYTDAGVVGLGSSPNITRTGNGLGVKSGNDDGDPALDGLSPNEVLRFLFSALVTIEEVTFRRIATGSVAEGFVNDLRVLTGFGVASPVNDPFGVTADDLFGIGATDDASSFRVSSMTVSWDDPSIIPLPAGGVLLISGLGAIALLRRKRMAA